MEQLPANLEAERALISSLATHPEWWKYVEHLTAEHFTDIQSIAAFQQMLKRKTEGRQWFTSDMVEWVRLGSESALDVPELEELVKRIQDAHVCRIAADAAERILRLARDGNVSEVERTLSAIKLPSTGAEGASMAELAKKVKSQMGHDEELVIKCGFPKLDYIRILWRKETTGLAARPGMGKSQLAAQIGANVASNGGVVVAWSGEMAPERWAARVIGTYAGVSVRYGDPNDGRFAGAFFRVEPMNNYIIYGKPMSSLEFASQCRRIADKCGSIDLFIVDHLAEMTDKNPEERHRLGHIMRNLRNLAKELNCCCLACIQLRRLGQRPNMRPTLEDLRDSGEIEQALDTAAFLYREAYYKSDANDQSGIAEFYTRKNREGRQWLTKLYFDSENGPRFVEMT